MKRVLIEGYGLQICSVIIFLFVARYYVAKNESVIVIHFKRMNVNAIKRFWWKSKFHSKLKPQKSHFKINNLLQSLVCLKWHFCTYVKVKVQASQETFFIFSILAKSRFAPQKFYNVDVRTWLLQSALLFYLKTLHLSIYLCSAMKKL